ncbi:zinc ribbon domain-containing protein [Promineifilum sp.]|uniref:zinc ribbon domain-containing protein n=1 Tax=Promineifilum sp. TaxID=2664178 RepID=UPI0035B25E5C
MSQARVLYDLQQLDSEIRSRKHRLGEVIRLQKEPPALVAARERAAAAEAELQRWRARQKDLSLEIGGLNDKARRSEERLYSGNIKNPKELSDLQHEVEALGRRRAALEDEALTVMMTLDEHQSVKTAADAEVEQLAGDFRAASATLNREQQTLAMHLNQLLEKRQRQAALAQPAPLKAYDQLSKQKNGLAVAGLRGNKCMACQVTVSASTIKAVNEGKLVQCDSCDRLLCPL